MSFAGRTISKEFIATRKTKYPYWALAPLHIRPDFIAKHKAYGPFIAAVTDIDARTFCFESKKDRDKFVASMPNTKAVRDPDATH